jgi:hypothetical protein
MGRSRGRKFAKRLRCRFIMLKLEVLLVIRTFPALVVG